MRESCSGSFLSMRQAQWHNILAQKNAPKLWRKSPSDPLRQSLGAIWKSNPTSQTTPIWLVFSLFLVLVFLFFLPCSQPPWMQPPLLFNRQELHQLLFWHNIQYLCAWPLRRKIMQEQHDRDRNSNSKFIVRPLSRTTKIDPRFIIISE
jgi:hypothetical protein